MSAIQSPDPSPSSTTSALSVQIIDTRISSIRPLYPPSLLLEELAASPSVANHVLASRRSIQDILHRRSDRLLVVVGPCSIHDVKAAMDYARRLRVEAEKHKGELMIVMRCYFSKPRTRLGWKGLISDPLLDGEPRLNLGLRMARGLMLDIEGLGLPVATEMMDTITPQFIADLISWTAIGARTAQSQLHRELVSGLSMPVGFKNSTDGNVQVAVDAISSSRHAHAFLSVTLGGLAAIVNTRGNNDTHVVLRGSTHGGANYSGQALKHALDLVHKAAASAEKDGAGAGAMITGVMIDCSHGNSGNEYKKQLNVVDDIERMCDEDDAASSSDSSSSSSSSSSNHVSDDIVGVMIESNIVEGSQKLPTSIGALTSMDGVSISSISSGSGGDAQSVLSQLTYGQSITDGCISWDDTMIALDTLARAVSNRRTRAAKRGAK